MQVCVRSTRLMRMSNSLSLVKERVSPTKIGTFYPTNVLYWTFFALHHTA